MGQYSVAFPWAAPKEGSEQAAEGARDPATLRCSVCLCDLEHGTLSSPLDPQLSTINRRPSAFNLQPSTLNPNNGPSECLFNGRHDLL